MTVVQTGINNFGIWIPNSKSQHQLCTICLWYSRTSFASIWSSPMLTIPINYTQLGGTYEVLSGISKGSTVFGQDPLWLAWVTDLGNTKVSDPATCNAC